MRTLIESKGYTQVKLAREAGISLDTIRSYVSRGVEPTLPKACAMARALHVPLKELAHALGCDVTGIPECSEEGME